MDKLEWRCLKQHKHHVSFTVTALFSLARKNKKWCFFNFENVHRSESCASLNFCLFNDLELTPARVKSKLLFCSV